MATLVEARIYLPEYAQRTWEDFKKICRREGSSASDKLREYMTDYVDRHRHGNPQTVLPTFSRPGVNDQGPPHGLPTEMPCDVRTSAGYCKIHWQRCSRETCPRQSPAYKKWLEHEEKASGGLF